MPGHAGHPTPTEHRGRPRGDRRRSPIARASCSATAGSPTPTTDRTRRLAHVLHERGLGARPRRAGLAGHESHQDHLAIYLYNGNEYLEAMLGAYKARVAPFNVNYRYVAEELRYLLDDSGRPRASSTTRVRADAGEVLPDLPS